MTWSELNATQFLPEHFYWSYTLGVVRRWNSTLEEDENTLCEKLTRLLRLLAGADLRLQRTIINHILESDFRSWGRCAVVNADTIKRRIMDADENEDLLGVLSNLTVAALIFMFRLEVKHQDWRNAPYLDLCHNSTTSGRSRFVSTKFSSQVSAPSL